MKKLLFILVSFPLFTFSQLTRNAYIRNSQLFSLYQYKPVTPNLVPGITQTDHGPVGFYEFKPSGYDADSAHCYPLIIFLHGVGERGNGTTDLSLILNSSFSRVIANGASMNFTFQGKKAGFLVLLPQMSKDYINWQNFYTDAMIDYAKQHLKVDTNRIFLCGWSLGGGGAWKYVTSSLRNARRIAGIVVTGPAPDFQDLSFVAKAQVAVWIHHATDDASVPLHLTIDAVREINTYKPDIPPLVNYYYPGGHPLTADAPFDTTHIYLYPNPYEWMLGISRKNRLATNLPPVPVQGNDTSITVAHNLPLNASASYDPDGVIIKYHWRLAAGPPSAKLTIQNPNRPVTTVSGFELGDYTFRLTVEDPFRFTRSGDVHVHVGLPAGGINAAPYVFAGKDVVTSTDNCTLSGYMKDFDGNIASCRWRQISGPAPVYIAQHGENAYVRNMAVAGVYGMEFTACDNGRPAGIGRDTVLIKKIASTPVYVLGRYKQTGPQTSSGASAGMLAVLVCFMFVPVYLVQLVGKRYSRLYPGFERRYATVCV